VSTVLYFTNKPIIVLTRIGPKKAYFSPFHLSQVTKNCSLEKRKYFNSQYNMIFIGKRIVSNKHINVLLASETVVICNDDSKTFD